MTRTITTEAELDALPVGSIVRSARGHIAVRGDGPTERHRRGGWHWQIAGVFGSACLYDTDLPAAVLHVPGRRDA